MKKWLTIIVLLLTAAMAFAEDDGRSMQERVALPTAVLSQDNGDSHTEPHIPLLATPAGVSMQLCGAEPVQVKGGRHTAENVASGIHSYTTTHTIALKIGTAAYPACLACVLLPDRYIYFLHRIII